MVSALVDPETLAALDHLRWNSLLRQARRTRLLARLARDAEQQRIRDAVPPKARDLLTSARYVARDNARAIAWECNRIERALRPLNLPLVLLKGTAYATASLPPARGRLSTDVDILVPRAKLAEVERTLQAAGWEHVEPSNYVQRYYRRWMHELPPLRHATRGTFVDVHHTILPTTGRVQPDAERLWRDAVATDVDNIQVLAPEDMVLHSAAHLFQDGDLNYAIRDLVDVADLLRHFSRDPQFWGRLVERAALHELQRTLFYALRYGNRLLGLEVPEATVQALAAAAPPAPLLRVMDRLVPRALLPGDPDAPHGSRAGAALLLYLRSHWLRMPPWMLAAHLSRQAATRALGAVERSFAKQAKE